MAGGRSSYVEWVCVKRQSQEGTLESNLTHSRSDTMRHWQDYNTTTA
uniref:Uncharacterized protein n=1 Tax=Anguilla anguilla TaxID=7936 RepID=A0A0E9RF70_ANGAN